MILGLMGQKRAGKDSLAAYLTSEHGFARFAFADRLKAVALETDPTVLDEDLLACQEPDCVSSLLGAPRRLSEVVEEGGWERAKEWPSVRNYLQRLGVAVRNNLGEETWIRPVIGAASITPRAVVTDVRFPNEAEAIRNAGGLIVRVDRPGLPDNDSHVSEHAWRAVEPDFIVRNDSDHVGLRHRAKVLVAQVEARSKRPPNGPITDLLDRLAEAPLR